jgi:hypothetical protein
MYWRHPGANARMINVRPTILPRTVDAVSGLAATVQFTLRAADPRHYGATQRVQTIPVSAKASSPTRIPVVNAGNSPAYPVITVTGPTSGSAVTRVSLVNDTSLTSFDVVLTLVKGGTIVGDMPARVTGANRSIVTLDGQSKYGAWQLPREPFRIDPDPLGLGGYNLVSLRTVADGAPVTCTLTYRDTFAG